MPSLATTRRQQRQIRLREFGYADYSAYLRSGAWRERKADYWASDQPQDCICGKTDGLQLHHLTYERVGDEPPTDLTPLCPNCHAMIHTLERRGEIGLDFTGFVSEKRAERYRLESEGKRLPAFDPMMREDKVAAEMKSRRNRLGGAVMKAFRRGDDMVAVFDQVDALITSIERKT